jgi:protein TonB
MKPYCPNLRAWTLIATLFTAPALGLAAADGSEPPVPVRTVPPEIPPDFARQGSSGLVTVNFLVDEKGQVQDASVEKSSHRELESSALKAVSKWRFKPARKEGTPVAIRVSIPIKFEIQ